MSDLADLFARDPLSLTKSDLTTIVAELRKSRHAFNAGNLRAGSTKAPSAAQKKRTTLAEALDMKIDL